MVVVAEVALAIAQREKLFSQLVNPRLHPLILHEIHVVATSHLASQIIMRNPNIIKLTLQGMNKLICVSFQC